MRFGFFKNMLFFKMRISCFLVYILTIFINYSCAQNDNSDMYTNKLINESSPYLLQHAQNPVDWYPWGTEALKKAQEEDKLLVISIGYSSCHWCHVMEHESFEDTSVASLMNDKFVSIKVDREERPDIDQIYMEAAQLIKGSGGWPLNAIALPDGRPIYAGTYFPKDQWMQVLNNVDRFYRERREKALEQARNLTEGIRQIETSLEPSDLSEYKDEELEQIASKWLSTMDKEWGGQKKAPKFPMPIGLEFLMEYQHFTGDLVTRNIIETTLDKMAWGGIYDAVGGGFARYSTDRYWKVPHFEKMLYDNAQLISIYSKAYQIFKKDIYKDVVFESLKFIEREMTGTEGQFYSALDADTEGEEGKFYVWNKSEWDRILGEDAKLFSQVFTMEENGNWEHGNNVLFRKQSWSDLAKNDGISKEELKSKWYEAKKKLLSERNKRERPGLDDKSLTAWNALMLKAYVDAYRVFNEEEFLLKAKKNAQFIQKSMVDDKGNLLRNFKDGKAVINGFLDDYALSIQAFIHLYQASFEKDYLNFAKTLCDRALEKFNDPNQAMMYYTSIDDEKLIARKKDIADNVIPSSNSVMANNLLLLSKYYESTNYAQKAADMLSFVRDDLPKYGIYYANWSRLLLKLNKGIIELAIVGKDCVKIRKEIDQNFIPSTIFLGTEKEENLALLDNKYVEDKTMIFVCQNKVCDLPVDKTSQALNQIRAIQIE